MGANSSGLMVMVSLEGAHNVRVILQMLPTWEYKNENSKIRQDNYQNEAKQSPAADILSNTICQLNHSFRETSSSVAIANANAITIL